VNVEILLNDIDWRYCNISFMVNASAKKIVSVLGDYWHQHSLDPAAIEGSIFWDGIPQLDSMELDPFLHQMEFHTLGIVVSDATPVQEIATALAQATVIMDRLTDLGLNKAVVLSHISFSMRLETDFFIAIAKLKALRMLWFQLASAFEIRDVDPAALEIHGWVAPWKQETMEPHSNLLKGTTAALAAVLGGCNGITVSPEDENNTLMTRIARNVSVLFQDEAHLGMVADPLAGAYALDVLVDRTAAAAWQMFQQMMKNQ
jgi:methylmalonyl-CoA mutase